jgi:DNA-binding PadR family transcriptional regulator
MGSNDVNLQPRPNMPRRSGQRSPLALTILALLVEEPMHAYRMHELIRSRGKDTVVNVAQRNSVYQTIDRLLRSGLIRVKTTLRDEGRPERVVYELTAEGSAALEEWLRTMLGEPASEFPEFPAALAFLMLLPPKEAALRLGARAEALGRRLSQEQAATKAIRDGGLPRLFVIEDEYKQAMLRAELAWVKALIRDLRTRKLSWSAKWLRDMATKFDTRSPD